MKIISVLAAAAALLLTSCHTVQFYADSQAFVPLDTQVKVTPDGISFGSAQLKKDAFVLFGDSTTTINGVKFQTKTWKFQYMVDGTLGQTVTLVRNTTQAGDANVFSISSSNVKLTLKDAGGKTVEVPVSLDTDRPDFFELSLDGTVKVQKYTRFAYENGEVHDQWNGVTGFLVLDPAGTQSLLSKLKPETVFRDPRAAQPISGTEVFALLLAYEVDQALENQ